MDSDTWHGSGWPTSGRNPTEFAWLVKPDGRRDPALRSAARNRRLANLPIGITVAHGNHAWVLTGFSATADPAKTDQFTVTSVRVTGPLWGPQNRTYGYDMHPDTKLTRKQFKRFFTPWHYARIRMVWEGRWVSVQPVP